MLLHFSGLDLRFIRSPTSFNRPSRILAADDVGVFHGILERDGWSDLKDRFVSDVYKKKHCWLQSVNDVVWWFQAFWWLTSRDTWLKFGSCCFANYLWIIIYWFVRNIKYLFSWAKGRKIWWKFRESAPFLNKNGPKIILMSNLTNQIPGNQLILNKNR